jgi:hypothetical protein
MYLVRRSTIEEVDLEPKAGGIEGNFLIVDSVPTSYTLERLG